MFGTISRAIGHFVREARRAEIVLHIDHNQRGAASLDRIVGEQRTHSAHDAVLDRSR